MDLEATRETLDALMDDHKRLEETLSRTQQSLHTSTIESQVRWAWVGRHEGHPR